MNLSGRFNWTTEPETNNDYYILQYAVDGVNWLDIQTIKGAGTTSEPQSYSTSHRVFDTGTNYYRLIQVDFDGTRIEQKMISIDNTSTKKLVKRINTLGQEVNEQYKGLVILYYSDGSIVKIIH